MKAELTPTVVITGDQYVCATAADNIQLVANVAGTSLGTLTATWYKDNAAAPGTSNVSDPTVKYTESNTVAQDAPYYYTVSVVRGTGCVGTSEPYPVYVLAEPVVSISADETEICENGEITFTASVADASNITYEWSIDGTVQTGEINSTFTYTFATSGDHEVGVRVTNTLSECRKEAQMTVQVKALPKIESIAITPANDSICSGTQVTVTATYTTAHSAPVTFGWYRNGALMHGVNGASFNEVLTAEGMITDYIYTATIMQDASGCVATTTLADTVSVIPQPTISIQGDPVVCADASTTNVTLTAHVNDPSSASYTYEWRLFNETLPGFTGNTYSAAVAASEDPYVYTVVATDNTTGCSATSEPFEVTVNAAPIVTFNPAETTVCQGGVVTITPSLDRYDRNYTYSWSIEGSTIAGATALTYTTPEMAATERFIIEVTDPASSCKGTASFKVYVENDPSITSISLSADTICNGAQVEVAAVATGGAANVPYTYTWYRNGALLNGVTDSSFTDTPVISENDNNMVTYQVFATQNVSGCQSASISDTVQVYPNPTITITGDPLICGNHAAEFSLDANVSDVPDGVTLTYDWRLDNVSKNVNNTHYEGTLEQRDYPYEFTFVANSSVGCTTTESYLVYVNDSIEVAILATSDSVCPGQPVTLTANVPANFSALAYRWYANGIEIPGEVSRSLTVYPTAMTNYEVAILQSESLCTAKGLKQIKMAPEVNMNLVTALPTDVCEGAQITMTVSTTTASSTHNGTYSWYRNNMLVDENHTNTFIDSPMTVDNDTTTYIYTANFVEDLTGCTASISDTVVVYKNLNVVLSGDQYICAGQDIVLEANVNGHQIASESLVVNWYRDGADAGGSISYIPQSTSVLTLPTTTADIQDAPYLFNVEASRGQGCLSTSEPYAVYVYGNPDVEITYDDNTVCVGGYTTLHATLAGSDENITYKWEEGGTTISGATTDTYVASFVSTGTKTFKAIVINALTLCSDTATININVVADPEISAIEIDRDTVCNGYQVTVNATATGGVADPYTYTWFKNGEVIEGATGSVIYDTPEAQGAFATRYIYGVSVSQASVGCVSEIKYDTVYIMPNPSVVISGDAVICDNDSIRLNANVNDYNETMGALAYQWKENNVDLTDASATTNRLGITRGQQDEPYIYTVVVTNETDGCSTTSDPYYVYVNDSVIVEVTSTVDSICVGGEVTFTANLGDYNSNNIVYRWYTINGADTTEINGATSRTLTVNPTDAGVNKYMVNVLQSTSMCLASGVDSVLVIDAPEIELTLNRSMICSGGEIILTAQANQSGSFSWFRQNQAIAGATQATLTDSPLAVDNDSTRYVYGVLFTSDVEGCSATKDTFVFVYPNPTIVIEGDPMICNGSDVVLRSHINGYDTTTEHVNYQWMLANENIPAATNSDLTYTGLQDSTDAYIFTVAATYDNGCRSISDEYPVYINHDLHVNVAASDTTVCEGGEVTLTAVLGNNNDNN